MERNVVIAHALLLLVLAGFACGADDSGGTGASGGAPSASSGALAGGASQGGSGGSGPSTCEPPCTGMTFCAPYTPGGAQCEPCTNALDEPCAMSAVSCPAPHGTCPGQVCMLQCDATTTCADANDVIRCGGPGATSACAIDCDDTACAGKTIECPPYSSCTVRCNSAGSCFGTTILCGTGPCYVRCSGGGACDDTTSIRCGVNVCHIDCGNAPVDIVPDPTSGCGTGLERCN